MKRFIYILLMLTMLFSLTAFSYEIEPESVSVRVFSAKSIPVLFSHDGNTNITAKANIRYATYFFIVIIF